MLGLSTFFIFRTLQISFAAEREDIEVYESSDEGSDSDTLSAKHDEDEESTQEIRLSRPDEAAERIADQGYDLVPGAEKLGVIKPKSEDSMMVPRKVGRSLASQLDALPEGPVEPRSASRSPAGLEMAQPLTMQELRERRQQSTQDVLIPSNRPVSVKEYGLTGEPRFQTSIDDLGTEQTVNTAESMMGNASARNPVQEQSLIVSDDGFYPSKIFVTQNIPVKLFLTTNAKTAQCFIVDDLGVKKGVSPGKVEEIVFVPREARDYRFYCPMRAIEGKMTVRAQPIAAPERGVAAASEEKEETEKVTSEEIEAPKKKSKELMQKALRSSGVPSANEPKNAKELRAAAEAADKELDESEE